MILARFPGPFRVDPRRGAQGRMAPCGVEGALSLPGRARQPDRRSGQDRAHRAARDPACLEGRLDLAARERQAAGDGGRSRGPSPVPLPPRVSGAAGAGEVRQSRALRRAAARAARGDGGTHGERSRRPRARLCDRRSRHQPGVVPGRARTGTRRPRVPMASRRSRSVMSRCAASGSRSVFARSTDSRCGRRSSMRSSQRRSRSCSPSRAARGSSATGWNGDTCALTGAVLNDYIKEHLGEEFTAKDFRTWGGTLTAAIALAKRGVAETEADAKKVIANVMRIVGERLGKYARRRPFLVRQPGGGRAVSRRENARRFPAEAFTGRAGARYGARSRGASAREPVAIVANTPFATGRMIASVVSVRVLRIFSSPRRTPRGSQDSSRLRHVRL